MTKANIYRLVEAMTAHAWEMRQQYKREGNERQSEHYLGEWMGLNGLRVALQSKETFDSFCEIYLKDELNKPH